MNPFDSYNFDNEKSVSLPSDQELEDLFGGNMTMYEDLEFDRDYDEEDEEDEDDR